MQSSHYTKQKAKETDLPPVEENSFKCFKIVPLDNKSLNESKDNPNEEFLLKPPFFSIFLGPSRAGKTTAMLNLLKNKTMFYKQFEEVYFFVPTWFDDAIYTNNVKIEDKYIITDYSPEIFTRIIKEKEAIVEAHKKVNGEKATVDGLLKKCLFVVDDNIGKRDLSGRLWTMMDVLATRGRKYNISTCLLIQALRGAASKNVRGNTTDVFIFYLPDGEEQKKVLSEFQGSVDKKDILAMYRQCFKDSQDKWSFFNIKNFETNNFIKFRKNFDTFLVPPSLQQLVRKRKCDPAATEKSREKELAQDPPRKKSVQTKKALYPS